MYEDYARNEIKALESNGWQVRISQPGHNNVRVYNISCAKGGRTHSVHLSTYPGFCGGAMMYSIPSIHSVPKEFVDLVRAFLKNLFHNCWEIHVVTAIACNEDYNGQEEFCEAVGFDCVDEFVSTKTCNMVKRYEMVLADQHKIGRCMAWREERAKAREAYDEEFDEDDSW